MKKPVLLLFILSIQLSFSQSLDTLKLNAYFDALKANNKFMGSVGLLKDGAIVYTNQIGFTDVKTKQIPNPDTKYRIGSISKTYTAVLVLMAIEENKLDLNNTIENYFPNLKNNAIITIHNLLNHRSGIPNFTNDASCLGYNTTPKTESEMVSLITSFESAFVPDSKMEYSNSNYVLLSFILEKIYKKPFGAILNDKIVNPLQLKNTFFGGSINLNNNEAYSYVFTNTWEKQTETHTSIPLGAGGIVSTPKDILLFAEALFSYKIISEKSLLKMTTLTDNFGLGLFKIPFYDTFSFGHTGGIDGFSSVFGYFPKEKYGIALTSNGTNFNNNAITIALLSCLFNKPFEVPNFKTISLKTEDLEKYLGIYSSAGFPLKITISKKDAILMAQATGQPSFSLEAVKQDIFQFTQAGIVLEFNPELHEMTLKQGGGVFKLTKE